MLRKLREGLEDIKFGFDCAFASAGIDFKSISESRKTIRKNRQLMKKPDYVKELILKLLDMRSMCMLKEYY